MLLDLSDPKHQPGSMTVSHHSPSPKQAKAKTFASVASTPKTPAKTQQTSPVTQTPTKPVRAKADVKKTSPVKGKQLPKKGPNQFKGKVDSKPKQVTLSQKLADVDKQIAIKAKQADKSDSPKMKKPFDEVMKPIKTTERIVETPDGKGYQLLSEEEKKKVDRDKKFKSLGLLHFSDDEEDELSLETINSNKSKSSNKSQGSQKSIAKPKPKQPVTPKQPSNLMPRTGSKQVKESEMTPFHKDALTLVGGLATPVETGSNAGGWTIHGSSKRPPNICDIFSPVMGNMLGTRDPTPPNSDSDVGSAGSNSSNRHAVLQDDEEEEVSNATTDILPIDEIPESTQEGAVLAQPDTNKTTVNAQVAVAEPVVEGGPTPQEEDPQPDGVVSSKDANFIKAESEQVELSSSFDSKANNCNEDTAMGVRVSDPTEISKSVVPSDTTDQRSNGVLECNASRVATSEPKKNRKSKCGPNKIHASKHAIKRSKRGALVDRGANGGILGNDAKVIFKRNKTVDVTGIDNDELNALPMVDATAKAIADKGPVILILRNCAYHGLNRTLHSAGQIEWHLNKVHDTSMKVGGRQVIKTVDGCYLPINIIRGLPCIQMEPNTAKEFDTLPHVTLTQGGEWDPTALDHMLTDDPDWVSKVKREEDQEHDSSFDNRGECKHREPVRAGVTIDNPTGPPSEDPDDIEVNLHNGEIEVNFHADDATREVHQAHQDVSNLNKIFVYEGEGMPDAEVEMVEDE